MESSQENPLPKPESSKSPRPSKKSRTDGGQCDNGEFPSENTSNQLVLYNKETSHKGQDENGENHSSVVPSNQPYQGLTSIGAFTVQCAKCFKWRLIPTKEKYEEIREHILQEPFVCERAREWRPDITCDDIEDISQDGSRVWAIDKPSIAQPPAGWDRLIRIRGQGGTKFADVYYTTPTGKKLRSMVEVERHLAEKPEYVAQGVRISQFSFQIPKPLEPSYVRKPAARTMGPRDGANAESTNPRKPEEVIPIAWAAPPTHVERAVGEQVSYPENPPAAGEQVSHSKNPSEPLEVEPLQMREAVKLQSGEAHPDPGKTSGI